MLKINTDAAFKASELEAGIGIEIASESERILLKFYVTNVYDNHAAEFIAGLFALHYIKEHFDCKQLILWETDSRILTQSLEKRFAKHPQYSMLLEELLQIFDTMPQLFVNWIPDTKNKGADSLAKQSILKQGKLNGEYIYPNIPFISVLE